MSTEQGSKVIEVPSILENVRRSATPGIIFGWFINPILIPYLWTLHPSPDEVPFCLCSAECPSTKILYDSLFVCSVVVFFALPLYAHHKAERKLENMGYRNMGYSNSAMGTARRTAWFGGGVFTWLIHIYVAILSFDEFSSYPKDTFVWGVSLWAAIAWVHVGALWLLPVKITKVDGEVKREGAGHEQADEK